jgi:ubiquinone/menaquinone biosynthesis C-methylase UbiE/uncharacterized protein YbaR (Trm112 family)
MKKKFLTGLLDPNDGTTLLEVMVLVIKVRGQEEPVFVENETRIEDECEVDFGFLLNPSSECIFPIEDGIPMLLSMQDMLATDLWRFCDRVLSTKPKNPGVCALIERVKASLFVADTSARGWCQDEMAYYDSDVSTKELRDEMVTNIQTKKLWHIFLEREKYLLSQLSFKKQQGARVLEVGCGNSRTVSQLLPPSSNNFTYFGADVSRKRLLVAKEVVPEGQFIQCSATKLPFSRDSFDGVLAFGVLHHLESPIDGLKELERVSGPHGKILIHEPMEKPEKFLDSNFFNRLKKKFETYEHSEHDNEIELDEFEKYINQTNLRVESKCLTGSVLRTAVVLFAEKLRVLHSRKTFWKAVLTIDSWFNKLFCKKPNSLGPNSAFLLLRKS